MTAGGRYLSFAWVAVICSLTAAADITLPGFFGDGMVLQRNQVMPVWGWGEPGETVGVSFADQKATAVVDEYGNWQVKLEPMKASSAGKRLVVNDRVLEDVLVGDVWLCSGSGAMAFPLRKNINSRGAIQSANEPLVRIISINQVQSPLPEKDATGTWVPVTKGNIMNISASSYFFARKLHQELGIPIGIIHASWGGTNFNSWTAAEGFRDEPALKFAVEKIYNGRPSTEIGKQRWQKYLQDMAEWLPGAKTAVAKGETPTDRPEIPTDLWITNIVPTKVFNGMINPLVPYAISGVIWEHEDNPRNPAQTASSLRGLINGWRLHWKRDLPFYFSEIQGIEFPNDADKLKQIRAAQRQCLDLPNTGMIQTNDLPVPNKHAAQNKQPIGERFAKQARRITQ